MDRTTCKRTNISLTENLLWRDKSVLHQGRKKPGKSIHSPCRSQTLEDRKGYETWLEDKKRNERRLEKGNGSLHRSTVPCLCGNGWGYYMNFLKVKLHLKILLKAEHTLCMIITPCRCKYLLLPFPSRSACLRQRTCCNKYESHTGACFGSFLFRVISEVKSTTKWSWLLPEKLFWKLTWPGEIPFNWCFIQKQLEHICCGLFESSSELAEFLKGLHRYIPLMLVSLPLKNTIFLIKE